MPLALYPLQTRHVKVVQTPLRLLECKFLPMYLPGEIPGVETAELDEEHGVAMDQEIPGMGEEEEAVLEIPRVGEEAEVEANDDVDDQSTQDRSSH